MAKWRVKKEKCGIFNWVAESPTGHRKMWAFTHDEAIRSATKAAKDDVSVRVICELVENVNRLTVVGAGGRVLEAWNIYIDDVALQDDGQTLKIFYREKNND